jgi:hypothetical protein
MQDVCLVREFEVHSRKVVPMQPLPQNLKLCIVSGRLPRRAQAVYGPGITNDQAQLSEINVLDVPVSHSLNAIFGLHSGLQRPERRLGLGLLHLLFRFYIH